MKLPFRSFRINKIKCQARSGDDVIDFSPSLKKIISIEPISIWFKDGSRFSLTDRQLEQVTSNIAPGQPKPSEWIVWLKPKQVCHMCICVSLCLYATSVWQLVLVYFCPHDLTVWQKGMIKISNKLENEKLIHSTKYFWRQCSSMEAAK